MNAIFTWLENTLIFEQIFATLFQPNIGGTAMRLRYFMSLSIAVAASFLIVTFQLGCRSGTGADGTGLLPTPQPGQINSSKYEPEKPYTTLAPGILTRTLHEAAGQAGYRIEVRDLLVGPKQRAVNVSLPGAAVFQIRSGSGVAMVAGQSQEISAGSTFALSDGQTFSIENKSDNPIIMRAHLFIAN